MEPNQPRLIWLDVLRRASEELVLTSSPHSQLDKLARLFGSELKVDRVSILLLEEGTIRLAAGVGLPPDLQIGSVITPGSESITRWVLENRRPRLVQGSYDKAGTMTSPVRSALCAPIAGRDQILGAVNFSSMATGRTLTEEDLATAEIFSTMLAFAISNQRLFEENLESERLATVGLITASVGHCIKNVLQLLKGSVFLARTGLESPDETDSLAQGIEMAEKGTQRLESLILDLLDISRQREPDLDKIRPREILEEVKATHVYSYGGKYNLEVECELEDEFLLDAHRLRRALANLVSNSIDAMPTGGTVRLSTRLDGDEIVFAVSDDGPGIPAEKRQRIFEPFFSTKGSKGTGLGLAMVQKFCEENQGMAVALDCPDLGGVRIELRLPVSEARAVGLAAGDGQTSAT